MTDTPFWKTKKLSQMTHAEWESLCDGCGKCCLHKLQDADTGEIVHTDVACRLLDRQSCRCTNYAARKDHVPDCESLTAKTVPQLHWLPITCAYRRLANGQDLPDWHPLVTGDPESVHRAGQSVRGRARAELPAHQIPRYTVLWDDL